MMDVMCVMMMMAYRASEDSTSVNTMSEYTTCHYNNNNNKYLSCDKKGEIGQIDDIPPRRWHCNVLSVYLPSEDLACS